MTRFWHDLLQLLEHELFSILIIGVKFSSLKESNFLNSNGRDYDVEDVEHDFRFRSDKDKSETLENVQINNFKVLNDGGRSGMNLTQVESTG